MPQARASSAVSPKPSEWESTGTTDAENDQSKNPNYEEFYALAREKGFADQEINERLGFFGGFEDVLSMTASRESTHEDQP